MEKSALYDMCYRAHYNTSFSPDKRAKSYSESYMQQLADDLERIEGDENKAKYTERYWKLFSTWMHAKSRCLSSMITGPARFPTRRAESANKSEQAHYEAFENFRERWKKGPPQPRATTEDMIETLPQKLAKMEAFREKVKEQNKKDKKEFGRFVWGENKYTYAPYVLKNLGANIRRVKKQIEEMDQRKENKEGWEDIQFDGGYVTVGDDRLRVMFDEKPTREVINLCKSNGLRRSPRNTARQRQFTNNGLRAINRLLEELKQQ